MKANRAISIVTAAAVLAVLLIMGNAAKPTAAFSSISPNNHKLITDSALVAIGGFSVGARSKLSDRADDADYDYFTADKYHFTTCTWNEGTTLIWDMRSMAAEAAHLYYHNPSKTSYRDKAYLYLGYLFHAAEDFYAHSNWIENQPANTIARLGNASRPAWWYSGYYPDFWPYSPPKNCSQASHAKLHKDDSSRPGFAEAVGDAKLEVRYQWSAFENVLRSKFGTAEGNAIIARLKQG